MSQNKSSRVLSLMRGQMPIFRGPSGVVYVNGQVLAVPSAPFSRCVMSAFVAAYPGETLGASTIRQAIDALLADATLCGTDRVPDPLPVRLVNDDEAPDPRPEIPLVADVHETTQRMIDALRADVDLYQRGGALAYVVSPDGDADVSPVTRQAPLSWLVDRVSKHARCVRRFADPETGATISRHVPPDRDAVRAVLEHGSWGGIRELRGIAEAPFLRLDGSVMQRPGYDESTRYLHVPNADFAEVPEAPSQADATASLVRLLEPFADFPYVDPSHRFAAVAAVLTLLARPSIRGSVPCWVLDASAARSGKSLQVDVIHILATGRPASRMTYPEQDEELEKVLAGYALSSAATVNFDNVARKFGGAALDKVITAIETVDLRLLGSTGVHTYPWRAVIFASGNNVVCRGDMLARVLAPRIESPLDNPETRIGLRHPNLRGWVKKERTRLVADALTILRAYAHAGRPDTGCAKWGGFEAWARLIPNAIVWAGGLDPMGARRGLSGDEDPERVAQSALVTGWAVLAQHSEGGLTSSQAIAMLYPDRTSDTERASDGHDDLREAIETLAMSRPGTHPSPRQLGDVIRTIKHRSLGGKKFTSSSAKGGVARWEVVPC